MAKFLGEVTNLRITKGPSRAKLCRAVRVEIRKKILYHINFRQTLVMLGNLPKRTKDFSRSSGSAFILPSAMILTVNCNNNWKLRGKSCPSWKPYTARWPINHQATFRRHPWTHKQQAISLTITSSVREVMKQDPTKRLRLMNNSVKKCTRSSRISQRKSFGCWEKSAKWASRLATKRKWSCDSSKNNNFSRKD